MAGGSYRGGSTVIHTGNLQKRVTGPFARKTKKKPVSAPGLHVLSKEDRAAVMKKVWASRRKSVAMERRRRAVEAKKRSDAFSKFVSDVKKLQAE